MEKSNYHNSANQLDHEWVQGPFLQIHGQDWTQIDFSRNI